MKQRIEYAAVEVYYTSGRYRVMPYSEAKNDCEAEAAKILNKADVSLFSDEAIERAAEAVGNQYEPWDESNAAWRDACRSDVRAVIAALKGDA